MTANISRGAYLQSRDDSNDLGKKKKVKKPYENSCVDRQNYQFLKKEKLIRLDEFNQQSMKIFRGGKFYNMIFFYNC